jgi:hypothetical protein
MKIVMPAVHCALCTVQSNRHLPRAEKDKELRMRGTKKVMLIMQ